MLSPLQTSLHGISLYLPLQGLKAHTPLQLESWPPFLGGGKYTGNSSSGPFLQHRKGMVAGREASLRLQPTAPLYAGLGPL